MALGLVGAVTAFSASTDESHNSAAEAVADLPTLTDFSFDAEGDGCAFDADRGGLVYQGLTSKSTSTGVLELPFYVQRDSLDDILPGYGAPLACIARAPLGRERLKGFAQLEAALPSRLDNRKSSSIGGTVNASAAPCAAIGIRPRTTSRRA